MRKLTAEQNSVARRRRNAGEVSLPGKIRDAASTYRGDAVMAGGALAGDILQFRGTLLMLSAAGADEFEIRQNPGGRSRNRRRHNTKQEY